MPGGDVVTASGASVVLRDIQKLFEVGTVVGLSDGQLLDRYIDRREGASFEALVRRHGQMVWGVCRRMLRDHHDAEDAFQATFLVLARRAATIVPREKVANWLYGVAFQTARRARATRARRRLREGNVPAGPEPAAVPQARSNELVEVLDHELSRLPDKYRVLIVLCELEGKTHGEAAEQLGWPVGTVSGRLSRARALLAERLTRRGVAVAGVALTALLEQGRGTVSACVPVPLLSSTVKAASAFATRQTATAVVSSGAEALTREVLKTMRFSRIKVTTVALMVLTLAGAALWQARTWADETTQPAGGSGATVAQPLADGTFRVTVNEVIHDEGTVVTQIGIETRPGSKIELLPDQENRNMNSVSVTTGSNDPAGMQLVVLGDHVQGQWKGGSANAVKFVLSYKVGKISSSTSETVPLPEGAKQLADVLTVPIKSGEYKYGQPAKLLTFKGVTYRLVVTRAE
jgi:RNA polymerase sigma factor (sigma-70 family)